MSFLTRLSNAWDSLRADSGGGQPAADSDFWYSRPGVVGAAGINVSPEAAMRLGAVYACVRVVCETIGSLAPILYRRLPNDGGRERAVDHPLYDLLRMPNSVQTGFEFWEMMQAHVELRGNAYAQIVAGNGRAVDQLLPIHPDRVRVFRLPDGSLRFEVTSYLNGQVTRFSQSEIFHVRGLSQDGVLGLSTISAAADLVGVGLAQQDHAARYFSNGAKPSGVLSTAVKLTKEAREDLEKSWTSGFGGANSHKTPVLGPGMTYQGLTATNKDAQLIEARQFSRGEIAAVFRLPPHKIGDLTRGTFSNIEQQNIEFATDSIRPRVVRLEQRINVDLVDPVSQGIGALEEYFCEFSLDSLLRGDLKSRYDAYAVGIQWGFLSPNDVCRLENRNPIDGGDTYLRPVNMAPYDSTVSSPPDPNVNQPQDGQEDSPVPAGAHAALVRALAASAAGRLVRREVKALRKLGESAFGSDLGAFYETFALLIQENLAITAAAAQGYCAEHSRQLQAESSLTRASLIDQFEEESTEALTALALEGKL